MNAGGANPFRTMQWGALGLSLFLSAALASPSSAQSFGNNQSVTDTTGKPVVQEVAGGGQTFRPGIKYLGGMGFPDFHDHETWSNGITVTADSVIFVFSDTAIQSITIPITTLSKILYGQSASRHVGAWIAAGIILAPIALLGIFHKSRHHFILLSWNDGTNDRGAYFESDGDLFRPLLNALSFRSGKPIFSDEKDHKWLLSQGVVTQIDTEPKDAAK
jgi:hypothetical protein